MSEPFDLDALIVEEEEAPPFCFTWGGKQYEIPLLAQLPVQTQRAIFKSTNQMDQLQLALGEDLIAELSTTPGPGGKPMTISRLAKLGEAWMEHQGLGKSPAPSPSSNGTAPQSRQTSRSRRGHKTS